MFSSRIDPKIKTPGVLFFVLVTLGLILIPGPAVAKETDREALALGERFRKIVTDKDLPALKKLMQPSYDACATGKNRKIYDAYISRLFAADMKAGFKSVTLEPIKPKTVKFLLTPGGEPPTRSWRLIICT